MGQKYINLSNKHIQFIKNQHVFFVGTADVKGRVNISPKGLDSLRVISDTQIVWLNLTGSANETSAHIQYFPRMTLMFIALNDNPMILRVYGQASVVHKNDTKWKELYALFDDFTGARQIFDLNIELVHVSCGTAVPLYEYIGQRNQLLKSFNRRKDEGTQKYWALKNQYSLDGKPTHIMDKNT